MTCKERILGAIRREKIDRVPVSTYELCGYNSMSFENREDSYHELMDIIRNKTDAITMWDPRCDINECLSSWQPDMETTLNTTDELTVVRHRLHTPAGRILTATEKRFKNVYTTWHTEHWCKDMDDVDAYLSLPFSPGSYDFSDLARLQRENGDHGIIMSSVGDAVCNAMELMEFGDAMIWAKYNTEHFEEVLQELHRRNMINLESMLEAGVVDLYRICGPEYLTPPYLPPNYFERFVTPYVTEMTNLIHRYGAYVRIHSHGRIGHVLDYILDCGADALDPCEAPPDGDITLADLKMRVADRLCIFGNLQLKLLENGNAEEIRCAVKLCMESAKGNTGYIIMPTASPINLPLTSITLENYKVFIECALETGRY